MRDKRTAKDVCGEARVIIVSAEGTSLVGQSGDILPQKMYRFGGYEMLFSALIMRCVSEKSTSNKCEKAVVFSAYKCLFPRSC